MSESDANNTFANPIGPICCLNIPLTPIVWANTYDSPRRWLYEFARWIIATTNQAVEELETLKWKAEQVNVEAIFAAERAQIGSDNSPFSNGSMMADDADCLERFFVLQLSKARAEHLLQCRAFFRKMILSSVLATQFDSDRQDQFEALFYTFLSQQALKAEWDDSGLKVDHLFAAIEPTTLADENAWSHYADASNPSYGGLVHHANM